MKTLSWNEAEDDAAALWAARCLGGVIDATEFEAWLAGHPDRRARFDLMRSACMDETVTQALEFHVAREAREKASDRPRHRATAWRPTAVALSAALALAAAFLTWPTARFVLEPPQVYETPAGQVRTVLLEDGSSVTLNGASRIRVRLAGNRRQVVLQDGEALFDVAHDASRPFTVLAGESRISVLGTRFDVETEPDRVGLTVKHGRVEFASRRRGDKGVVVDAGYRTALEGGVIAPPLPIGGDRVAEWREGWIEVQDMSLSQLVARLQRWTDKPIRIADPALGQRRVAGRFLLSDVEDQLDSLAALHGFAMRRSDDGYVLTEARSGDTKTQ